VRRDALVQICVLPGHFDGDFLLAQFGDVADDARQAPEELFDGTIRIFMTDFCNSPSTRD